MQFLWKVFMLLKYNHKALNHQKPCLNEPFSPKGLLSKKLSYYFYFSTMNNKFWNNIFEQRNSIL